MPASVLRDAPRAQPLLRSLIRLKMSDIFIAKRIEYHLLFTIKNAFSEIIHTAIV